MSNLINYVRDNQNNIADSQFNEVDALVLSWLSYYNYVDYLNNKGLLIKEIAGERKLSDREMYKDAFLPKKSSRLFKEIQKSSRFSSLELSSFCNVFDIDKIEQFSAITIKIKEDLFYISFRGTDPSFLGWEEDFRLAYLESTNSQKEGVSYLQREMDKYPKAEFILGGHSKGGNTAIYAGSNMSREDQKRIRQIYCFDGPGFPISFFESEGFLNIKDKIEKIIPPSSFVGILFNNFYPYRIVKSNTFLFLQHNPFCFAIKNDGFVNRKKRTLFSRRSQFVMNGFVSSMTKEERKKYIDIIFAALNKLKINDFNSFFYSLPVQIFHLFRIYSKVEKNDRKFFDRKTRVLISLFFKRQVKQKKEA
ncbi:MAG: Mbeg1-like protein [Bacilli bacterium]